MVEDNNKMIVDIAEKTVEKFAREWEQNPYLWDSEADVHGELYVRIKKALEIFGTVKGRYKAYMTQEAFFNRIYCKPLTYIEGGERYYPDIVIYEDVTFNHDNKEMNEPMLWVCEIKYKTQWGGDQNEANRAYDKGKLQRLLQPRPNTGINGTKYAYFVELVRTREGAKSHCDRVHCNYQRDQENKD